MRHSSCISFVAGIVVVFCLGACGNGQTGGREDTTPTDETGAASSAGQGTSSGAGPGSSEGGDSILSGVSRGSSVYVNSGCARCHRIGDEGGDVGPELTTIGARLTVEEMKAWIPNPKAVNPEATMPPQTLSEEDLDDLVLYLSMLN